MSKHTEGPWNLIQNPHTGMVFVNQYPIFRTGIGSREADERDFANARLIASAPELLEACKELIDMITDNRLHGPEVYKAMQAIAKAEGRE